MIKLLNTVLFLLCSLFPVYAVSASTEKAEQRIFIYGGDIELKFVEYVMRLADKPAPRICYLPTASADNPRNLQYWTYICKELGIEPHVLKVWIDSDTQKQSFEEVLLGMDAIVVGGGNTLNMLGIWNYQGIDKILKKALEKGIILSGGSAGAICWFSRGVSDSRPVRLSLVEGLGFLPYSHCSHYNVPAKKELYDRLTERGELGPGYACDEHAGILFTDGKVTDVVSSTTQARSYFVSGTKNRWRSTPLATRVLLRKGALDTAAYQKEIVRKELNALLDTPVSLQSPLSSFIAVQKLFAAGKYSEYPAYAASSIRDRVKGQKDREVSASARESILSARIIAIFTYGDFAAILSKGSANFYSLWYFVRESGEWKCQGEDIGGDSPADAEITFREKAPFRQTVKR